MKSRVCRGNYRRFASGVDRRLCEGVHQLAFGSSAAFLRNQPRLQRDGYNSFNKVSTYAANTAAVDLLKFAKNRFKKFYNSKLQKLSAKRELSDDEQMTLNTGGSLKKLGAK